MVTTVPASSFNALFVPLALAACGPETPVAPTPQAAQPELPAGSVSISGDDALAGVLSWSLPAVQVDDPDHIKALALAGTAAYDRKDYAGAARHWEHVMQVAPAESDYLEQVRSSIAEARRLGGLPPAKAPRAAQ